MNGTKKNIRLLIMPMLLALAILSLACTPAEEQCSADADCAPKECCHASGAVNEQYAPSCNGVLCTMECRPGTIDCGQGKIRCVENECKVVLAE